MKKGPAVRTERAECGHTFSGYSMILPDGTEHHSRQPSCIHDMEMRNRVGGLTAVIRYAELRRLSAAVVDGRVEKAEQRPDNTLGWFLQINEFHKAVDALRDFLAREEEA